MSTHTLQLLLQKKKARPQDDKSPAWDRLYSKSKSSPKASNKKSTNDEYTFTPDIKKSQVNILGKKENDKKTPIYDRLYKETVNREARLAEKAAKYDDKELTFKPTIKASKGNEKTNGDRLDQLYQKGRDTGRRLSAMHEKPKLKRKVDDEAELTFQPNLDWGKGGLRSRKTSTEYDVPRSISMERRDHVIISDSSDTLPTITTNIGEEDDVHEVTLLADRVNEVSINDNLLSVDDILDDEPASIEPTGSSNIKDILDDEPSAVEPAEVSNIEDILDNDPATVEQTGNTKIAENIEMW